MGNGLLTSMAITDALHIASLNRQSRDDDEYIARLERGNAELAQDCAGNLLEKLALRQALAESWLDHPLLISANAAIIHKMAARIISTPGASFDDVRAQRTAIRANDYKILTGGGRLPSKGTEMVGEEYIQRKEALENFVASLPREYRNAAPKEHF